MTELVKWFVANHQTILDQDAFSQALKDSQHAIWQDLRERLKNNADEVIGEGFDALDALLVELAPGPWSGMLVGDKLHKYQWNVTVNYWDGEKYCYRILRYQYTDFHVNWLGCSMLDELKVFRLGNQTPAAALVGSELIEYQSDKARIRYPCVMMKDLGVDDNGVFFEPGQDGGSVQFP